jgi:glutathione S-transferase
MIKLYGMTMSAHTRKVQWALVELGRAYDFQVVDLMKGEQHKPEYMALNPGHKTPTLVDGDTVIVESNAILLYLADTYGKGTLIAESGNDRWQAIQWLVWASAEGHGPLSKPWYVKILYPMMGQTLDQAALDKSYKDAQEPLRIMEAVLSRQTYFGGSQFSVADIALAEAIHLTQWGGQSIDSHPSVSRWFQEVSAREGYKQSRFKRSAD